MPFMKTFIIVVVVVMKVVNIINIIIIEIVAIVVVFEIVINDILALTFHLFVNVLQFA